MTDEYFIIVQYLVIELRRGNKGGKGKGCILGGQQEWGSKVAVEIHLAKGGHKGLR